MGKCKHECLVFFRCKREGYRLAACPEPPTQEHRVGCIYAMTAEESQNNVNRLIKGKRFDNKPVFLYAWR